MNPMMEENRKLAAVIVGKPEKVEKAPEGDVPLEYAAEEILTAIGSKDVQMLKAALKSFISLCGEYGEQVKDS